jgi:hypothetical protein
MWGILSRFQRSICRSAPAAVHADCYVLSSCPTRRKGVEKLPCGNSKIVTRRVVPAEPPSAVFQKGFKVPRRAFTSDLCRRTWFQRAVLANLVNTGRKSLSKEAQGPTLPYPTFSPRQSAILFLRPWHTPALASATADCGTGHGDDDVIRCSCRTRSRGRLEPPYPILIR